MGRTAREIPWLAKRDNGVYYVHWYEPGSRKTRRQSLGTTERVQASVRYSEFLLAANGSAPPPTPRGPTVVDVLSYYMAERVEPELLDKARYHSAYAHLIPYFEHVLLKDVDVPMCVSYRQYRQPDRLKPAEGDRRKGYGRDPTVRRELKILSSAARFALLMRRIGPEDMPTIKTPSDPPPRSEYLSRDELSLVYSHATGPLQDFIGLLYYTGARRGAIEGLTVGQVDLAGGVIDLQLPNATPRQRQSRKRKPAIPIVDELRPIIERLVAERSFSARLLPCQNYYEAYSRLLERLGLTAKRRPHAVRHTRATHLLQDGVSVYDVGRLLGDNPSTIEKVYGHHSAQHLAASLRGKNFKLITPVDRLEIHRTLDRAEDTTISRAPIRHPDF